MNLNVGLPRNFLKVADPVDSATRLPFWKSGHDHPFLLGPAFNDKYFFFFGKTIVFSASLTQPSLSGQYFLSQQFFAVAILLNLHCPNRGPADGTRIDVAGDTVF